MNSEQRAHIEEERLLRVLIGDARTTGAEDEHLRQCPQCRSIIEDLRGDLAALQRASAHYTPARTRRLTLPASNAPSRRPHGWRIAAGAALTLCLAAVLWWTTGGRGPGTAPPGGTRGSHAVVPDPVMLETRMMAENAMPAPYQAIMESLDGGVDQGFIDFVIPPLDEDSLS